MPGESVISGFDDAAPKSGVATAPEVIPAPAAQSPSPTPEPADSKYNWRRDKDRERGAADSVQPDSASKKIHSWETGANKSYLIPALEVPGFLVLLNIYDRIAYPDQTQDGKKVYSSTFSSTWDHLRQQ
ncbi:MAG: hypothetical protein H7Y05_11685, partial [Steroidobacteraceae bacterium]|nr:hypothetical protein [Deltaproteobacteria bacterium]